MSKINNTIKTLSHHQSSINLSTYSDYKDPNTSSSQNTSYKNIQLHPFSYTGGKLPGNSVRVQKTPQKEVIQQSEPNPQPRPTKNSTPLLSKFRNFKNIVSSESPPENKLVTPSEITLPSTSPPIEKTNSLANLRSLFSHSTPSLPRVPSSTQTNINVPSPKAQQEKTDFFDRSKNVLKSALKPIKKKKNKTKYDSEQVLAAERVLHRHNIRNQVITQNLHAFSQEELLFLISELEKCVEEAKIFNKHLTQELERSQKDRIYWNNKLQLLKNPKKKTAKS
jgi:hypothetical protein